MHLQLLVVWFGYYVFLVFVSTSFACGLYYLAELIEEHINIAKKVLVNTIKSEIGLHVALLLWDRKPVAPLLLGAVTHASYLRLLRLYPFIPLTADTSFLSLVLTIVNAGVWIRHFWHEDYGLEHQAAFLIVTVLAVPFIIVLSLAANDAVLPGAAGAPPLGPQGSKASKTMLMSLFGSLRRQRDAVMPQVTSQLGVAKSHGI